MSTAVVTEDEQDDRGRSRFCPSCDAPASNDASACGCGARGPFPIDPWVGVLLESRYRLVRRIAAGGFGIVFAARHVEAGLDLGSVAVKMLRHLERPNARRFLEEAALARKVRSPHLLEVFAVGVWNDRPYVVTPLLEGRTLRDLIVDGALTPARARLVVRQLLLALRALHQAGLVHRDVKPSNVIVGRDDTVTLLDFGIARETDRLQLGLATRAGTPGYMAPEQLAGMPVDGRADVYAVGVVWLELLAKAERIPSRDRALAASFTADVTTRPTVDAALARLDEARPRRPILWLGALLLLALAAFVTIEASLGAEWSGAHPSVPSRASRANRDRAPTLPAPAPSTLPIPLPETHVAPSTHRPATRQSTTPETTAMTETTETLGTDFASPTGRRAATEGSEGAWRRQSDGEGEMTETTWRPVLDAP